MITYYCPNCWNEISEQDEVCPKCGYVLEEDTHPTLEEKLLMSLRHPAPDIQMMAVQILGNLGSIQALPQFENIPSDPETDVYLLREVIQALSKIRHPKSAELLRQVRAHSSPLIRRLAEAQMKKIKALHE
jgi:HEAT repeat protein